jgi:hypothetical protein
VRTRLDGQACCGGRAHLRLGQVRIEDAVHRAHAARRDTKKFLCAGAGRRPRCQWVGAGERALARLREKLTRTEQRIPHRVTPDVQRQPSSPPCCDEVTAAPSSSVIPQVKVAQSIFGTSRLRRTHCVALKSHSRTTEAIGHGCRGGPRRRAGGDHRRIARGARRRARASARSARRYRWSHSQSERG